MKLKQATLYRLNESKLPLMIFYLALGGSLLLSYTITLFFTAEEVTISGMEMSSLVFIFCMGLNAFKPFLKMFLQNGISRLTLYVSAIVSLLILSLLCALIDNLLTIVLSGQMNYRGLFGTIYQHHFIKDLLWTCTCYFMFSGLGFLITNLYYRMNKILKVLVSVSIPLLLFVGLPIFVVFSPSFNLWRIIWDFFLAAMGINLAANTFNPMIAIGSFTLGAVILFALSYPLVRRATIKGI